MSKTCVKLCYEFATLHRGRGGTFKHTFWNSSNIFSLIVWKLKKKRYYACCSKELIPAICFKEFYRVTLNTVMNIMTEISYYMHTMTSVVVWLSCYLYIWATWTYLTTFYQCLRILFLKNSVCHEEHWHWMTWKKITKPFKKLKRQK